MRTRPAPRLLLLLALLYLSGLALAAPVRSIPDLVLEGGRREVQKGTLYESAYARIAYPNGDVPAHLGVCTDLVVRAFRNAGIDLQQRLHEDRVANPRAYPLHLWANRKPDPSIDHRRCQNLAVYFQRFARSLTTGAKPEDFAQYQPGDVVFYVREGQKHPWHVAIVSDKRTQAGEPYILHLFPPKADEALLTEFAPVHSHFRWPGIVDMVPKGAGPQ